MAMDEDELDRKLRELAAERGRSLDEVMGDSAKSKQRIQDAQSARIEEASAERARLSGSAEAAARGRSTDNIVDSPSFLKQALNNADQQERDVAAAAAQVRPRSSTEQVDIDPRGFIVPKVGDVVLCPGKWASQDMVGIVTATQFVDSRTSWNVDVAELSQVGPRLYGRAFSAWKRPSRTWFDVSEVRPARAEYVEDQDAWRVDNVKDLYANPGGLPVDEAKRAAGLEEYQALKQKLVIDTVILGAAGCAALSLVEGGGGLRASFATGVAAALAYVLLISRQVDEVGEGTRSPVPLRLLAPLGLIAALFLRATAAGGGAAGAGAGALPQLPPKEILAAVLGFLSYKLPLLYESSKQVMMTIDEASEGLEQGVNEGYKQWQERVRDRVRQARARESDPETTWNPFTKIRLTVTKRMQEDKAGKPDDSDGPKGP